MNVNTIAKEMSINTRYTVSETELYRYRYQPLSAGKTAPAFFIQRQHGLINPSLGNTIGKEAMISLQDLLDYGQPLVIFFLGAAVRSTLSIKKLEALQQSVEQQGGRLLILTTAKPKAIRQQLNKTHSLSLFHDNDNEIAAAFGLHNEQNPLWQWVSGIEEDEETLPAFYVIAANRKIAYRYVDFDFLLYRNNNYQSLFFMNEVLESVQQSLQPWYRQHDLYQLVS